FCFLVNDIFDVDKDLLNNRDRPIATGIVPIRLATRTSIFFAVMFIASTWFLSFRAFALSFIFIFITGIYSFINRKTGFLANLIVALMISATQWGTGILKPDEFLWTSSIFLLFLSIPREILLDWLDMYGDEKSGKKSIPLRHSPRRVKLLIVLFLILASLPLLQAIYTLKADIVLIILLALTVAFSWISFVPFFRKPDDNGALASVRMSHISYAFLILALFSR
ncbi:MAG: UbiA family prenyltransferase, partial [Bacteroidota bacterium]